MEGKIVLITGATSGIGEACARIFAENNCRLILTGRRKDRLEKIKNTLEQSYKNEVYILNFDIRKQKEVDSAVASLPDAWKNIDILINNAGLAAGFHLFQDASMDDWENMIDTNVKGLLYMSKAVIPLMISRGKGHIVNLGSTAGKEVYLKGNVYCASKFAVDAISKSLRADLLEHGIKVTQISPGLVETEFALVRFKGDIDTAFNVYKGLKPLNGDDIAGIIYYTASLPPHVCINDVVVTPLAQANSYYVNRK